MSTKEQAVTWWPDWTKQHPELPEFLADAEEEARNRGHESIRHIHFILALTNTKPERDALLARAGIDPTRLRDRTIYIEGLNDGLRSYETKSHIHVAKAADGVRYEGRMILAKGASMALETARTEAAPLGMPVAPANLIAAMASSPLTSFSAITLAKARALAGIPHERTVIAPGQDRTRTLRPRSIAPLILCGGGEPPETDLAALDIAAKHHGRSRSEMEVGMIFAASPDMGEVPRKQYFLKTFSDAGVRVHDVGLDRREDAAKPEVLERIASAQMLFFSGGRSEWIIDAILGTPALKAISAAADRGTVMMGMSAGTALWGNGMFSDLESGDELEYFRLLNWVEDVMIVPHTKGLEHLDMMRSTMRRFNISTALMVAHLGAIFAEPGWQTFREIDRGYAGSYILRSPDTDPEPIEA